MTSENQRGKLTREQALALRERMKRKKPRFRRQESWRYKRVTEVWRRPDGVDSKMRVKAKGWPKSAEVGYRGPKAARYLHPSGYSEVLVRNVDDVDRVNPETQVIRIAHTVGAKKRVEISARAKEKGVRVLNPKEEEKPTEEEEAEAEAATETEKETKEKEETEEAKGEEKS